MSEKVKTVRQTCKCENCGNEAEMIITCTLEPADEAAAHAAHQTGEKATQKQRTGQATCTHCGNEAEILIDI